MKAICISRPELESNRSDLSLNGKKCVELVSAGLWIKK